MSHKSTTPEHDGGQDTSKPEVFAVQINGRDVSLSRRDLLKAAAAASVTMALAGCGPSTPTFKIGRGTSLRQGPDESFADLASLTENDHIEVIARSPDNKWIEVKAGDKVGWIEVNAGVLNAPIEKIPVAADIPATYTATPTSTPTNTAVPPTRTLTPTPPGVAGTVEAGKTGINYTIGTQTYTLPCGSPIPANAICTCNCVSVPVPCQCVGYVAPTKPPACDCVGYVAPTSPPDCSCVGDVPAPCSCVGDTGASCSCNQVQVCSCNLVTYWYPN